MPCALVTGGSGFVGRHLVPFLRTQGFRVAVLGREIQPPNESVDSYQCDIRDAACVDSVVREVRPDWVFH
ncbi:MAG TPA: NAD-dependent epimerase/dehydratase family protein, partial [Terriglobales bacterium]|nr:NAD-dependent epimerase/dehydratase family protein [Terriglobales bacterium]